MANDQGRAHQRQAAAKQGSEEVAAPAQGAERTRTRPVYAPRTDIFETNDGLVILADIPGVSADGVDVTLERRVLTIRGRTQESPPQGFSPVYREYEPGDYERMFTLSEDIEAERIEANVKDGVLRLFLPKAGPHRPIASKCGGAERGVSHPSRCRPLARRPASFIDS